jgi:hypothetical protein
MGRGKSEDMNSPAESSFAKSKRERAEHASESGARREQAATTSKPKDSFVPSKGGILRVDKALWDAEHGK